MKIKTGDVLRMTGEDVKIGDLHSALENEDLPPDQRQHAMEQISKGVASAAIEAARRTRHPDAQPRYRFHRGARVRVG